MKVLLLTDGIFPYVMGGMQKHSYNLSKHLHEAGVEVHVAHCVYGSDPIPSSEEVSGHLGVNPAHIHGFRFPSSPSFPGHYILNSYRYSAMLYRHFGNLYSVFDLIYAQGFTGLHFIKPGVSHKLWVNLHGLEMFQPSYSLKERIQQWMLQRPALKLIRGAARVQSLGGKLTDLLQQKIPNERIVTCGIGIDSSWLQSVENTFSGRPKRGLSFVFIGRNETRKGLHILYDALSILEGKGIIPPKCSFHFIGPIPPSQQLVRPYCTYYGSLREEQAIQQIMRTCDVMLLPSLSEGMPTVILEAMACGLAVIASHVGAVSVQVGSENGRLTIPGSSESMAEAIADYIAMPQAHLEAQKKASHKKVAGFLWPHVIQEHIRLFEALLKSSK